MWITIITVFGMFTTLLLTKLRTDVVFLAAISLLFVTGVLDAKEACSGFSSTSVVAMFVGIVKMWSKKLGIAPSKLLIPLSYASGMGGVCTLIGTPPNLIINGLYADKTGTAMNVLATTFPGLFCLVDECHHPRRQYLHRERRLSVCPTAIAAR